jgi:DNA-binding transcriptional LysR family regulator
VDLLREGYDVALRAGTEFEPGLVARTLARTTHIAVAAPAYLAAHGTPRRARDLRAHHCLVGVIRGGLPQTHWPKAGGGKVAVESSFVSNDIMLLMDGAARGLGIAVLPTVLVGEMLERGALVRVLPELIHAEARVAIVYPEKEFMPPQVRAFIDLLVAWAPTGLDAATRAQKSAHQRPRGPQALGAPPTRGSFGRRGGRGPRRTAPRTGP